MLPNETQYLRAKTIIGLFDASDYAGRVIAKGKDALDLLHRMSTNDLRPLFNKKGEGAQTVLTNEKGRMVDLVTVINRGEDSLLLTSKGKEKTIQAWLDKFTIMEDAKFLSASDAIAQFILMGPQSFDLVRSLVDVDVIAMPQFTSVSASVGGATVLIQKSLRIAESGWTIFADRSDAEKVWSVLTDRVLQLGGAVVDAATFDVLRIESGIPIAPNELNEKHNPLEASIVSAVSFTKGCYIGQEVIARLDSYDKVQRHLLGVRLQGGREVLAELRDAENTQRESAEDLFSLPLISRTGESVGELTSFAYSPSAESVIGLAYIRTAHSNPGETLTLQLSPDRAIHAVLEKLPFEMELA